VAASPSRLWFGMHPVALRTHNYNPELAEVHIESRSVQEFDRDLGNVVSETDVGGLGGPRPKMVLLGASDTLRPCFRSRLRSGFSSSHWPAGSINSSAT